jgi:hypothetical protein
MIQKKKSSTFQNVRVVVRVTKVLDFKEMNNNFGQDKKISKSLELFNSMFVIEVDHIITIIWHRDISQEKTSKNGAKVYACVDMVGMLRDQNVKRSIQWANVLLEMG